MNSMILTTPSKIGASVKLQFIICIWTLKNQIWKNEFCCVHWPCDTMLTFPLKIQSFEKRKRHKFFVSYFWYFFSQKLFLLKTFTCFKTLSISGKNKMKRREFISNLISKICLSLMKCSMSQWVSGDYEKVGNVINYAATAARGR